MTNRDLINKSVLDMSREEKAEAVLLAKNLLSMMLAKMTTAEREQVLNSFGTYEIPERFK